MTVLIEVTEGTWLNPLEIAAMAAMVGPRSTDTEVVLRGGERFIIKGVEPADIIRKASEVPADVIQKASEVRA